ncbi:MAG: hypothetical protein U1A28_00825, partial [Patescibacteria group bacterium]|nr:hypothetical protein [Patescibacteria group bacterium]
MPPVETRTGVIRAARQKSALAPQDDRSAVIETLRTFARDAQRATGRPYTVVHRPTIEKQVPSWSHTQDNGARPIVAGVSEMPRMSELTPSPIKQARKVIRPLQVSPPIRTDSAPKSLSKDVAPLSQQSLPESTFVRLQEDKTKRPDHPASTAVSYGVADIAPLATRRSETDTQLPGAAEPPSRDIPFEQPSFAARETKSFRTYRADAIHDVEQNKRSISAIAAAQAVRRAARPQQQPAAVSARPFVIAGMIMIVVILISGFGSYWYTREYTQEGATAVRIPTFIASDAQRAVPFSTSRTTLLQTLQTAVSASGESITQIYPVYTEE